MCTAAAPTGVGLRLSQSCNFCHISVRRHPKAISQAGVGHRDAYSTRLNIAGQRCFCYDVDPVIAFVVSVHLHWETTKVFLTRAKLTTIGDDPKCSSLAEFW